jgi:hypothetical protein
MLRGWLRAARGRLATVSQLRAVPSERLTKACSDCRQAMRVELFDIYRKQDTRRSSQCKACRRKRQNRGRYSTCRNRALAVLADRYPDEYDRCRAQARRELAPDSAPAEAWDYARGRAFAELTRRHQADWQRRLRRIRAAHPDWAWGRVSCVVTNEQRRAHRQELLELMAKYAGAQPAGPRLVYKIYRRALRLLQLAHPEEFEALYAGERAKIGNPMKQAAYLRP